MILALLWLATVTSLRGQSPEPLVPLVVHEGRALRVVIDRRVTVKRVGQSITGHLLDPLFAYHRVVVPKGTEVIGHVETLVAAPGKTRARAMLSGDFTPLKAAFLQFDSIVLSGGRILGIQTAAVGSLGREPIGKMDHAAEFGILALPYHPNFIAKGTVYSATLVQPIDFGEGAAPERAVSGAAAPATTVLRARLDVSLDSSASPAGTRVEARLTEPLFDAANRLVLAEGATLVGEVTYAKRARWFRRNGGLRFLFDHVEPTDRPSESLKASLLGVESSNVVVDEEGGATITNSKARLVAPALAAVALTSSLNSSIENSIDSIGPEVQYGNGASGAVGGFLGFSALGIGIAMLGHTATVILASVGVARSVYSAFIKKGREVTFQSGTVIQLQLAPAPASRVP